MSGHAIPSDLPRLSPRALDSHKGTFGRALIVGGSRGMAGAPALAGMAALRSGAGLVNGAVAGSCQPIVAGFEPSYMVAALPEDEAGKITAGARETLEPLLESATALAIGPGLG